MISDLRAPATTTVPNVRGIHLQGGTTDNVYHNTVFLNASGTATNFGSAALYVGGGTTIDLKNNIFVNLSTPSGTGKATAFHKNNATFGNISATTDRNIYYAGTPDANHLIFKGGATNYQTLNDYKTLNVGKDQGSYTENTPFLSIVSPYNLHIDPTRFSYVEGNALQVALVTNDIDGDLRSATPDIGADEGEFFSELPVPALSISASLTGAIQLVWTPVTGASSYILYSSQNPDSGWTALTSPMAATTYDIAAPLPRAFYKVTASSVAPVSR
jgi:hypothetical protein